MKQFIKYSIIAFLSIFFYACEEEESGLILQEDSLTAPSDVSAIYRISDDNSGKVTVTPFATSASSFEIVYGDTAQVEEEVEPTIINAGETAEHIYAEGEYTITITAVGATGLKTEITQPIVIKFDPPSALDFSVETDELEVTVTPTAEGAFSFEVYFGEDPEAEPVQLMPEESATYTYEKDSTYEIRVVAIGAAIETTELTKSVSVARSQVPLTAAPTPTEDPGAVISIFSDAYTDVNLSELPTEWSATDFEAITLNADNVWKLSNLDFLGIVTNYDTGIDVSAMTTLHIDYWVPFGTTNELRVKIVNTVDGGEAEVSLGATVEGAWQSIDIPMTEFDNGNLANKEKITQILIDAIDGVAEAVYIDNFYFYNENGPVGESLGLPLDFSSEAQSFTTFNGASFALEMDPFDATNQVGNIMNSGVEFEGAAISLESSIDLSTNKVIRMRFLTLSPNTQVLLKLENGNADPVEVIVTAPDFGWNELSFDFTEANFSFPNSGAVDASGTYNDMVIFIDGPTTKPGSYLIDDIRQSGLGLPLDFNSTRQTMGTFNGAGFEIVENPENSADSVGQITNTGNNDEGLFLGLEEAVDFSADGKIIKLNFYAAAANTSVLVKFENGDPAQNVEVSATAENAGWNQLTFDFTAANGGTVDATSSYTTLVMFADLGTSVPGVHFVDDIRQVK